MEVKYFCEACKSELDSVNPKPCLDCELVHYCDEQCAAQAWPVHRQLCEKRQNDMKKLIRIEWEEQDSAVKKRKINNHRLKMAYEMFNLAEHRNDYWSYQVTYYEFQHALFCGDEVFKHFQQRGNRNYPGWETAAQYLYILLILGKYDEAKEYFVRGDSTDVLLNISEFEPPKKHHYFSRLVVTS